jgi:hypothetical protein
MTIGGGVTVGQLVEYVVSLLPSRLQRDCGGFRTKEASFEASVSPSTGFGGIEYSETERGGREGGRFVIFSVVSI